MENYNKQPNLTLLKGLDLKIHNMKKNIVYLFLLLTISVLSQDKKVFIEYEFTDFTLSRQTYCLLQCDNKSSIFKNNLSKYSLSNHKIKDDNKVLLAGKLINQIQMVKKDTLYSFEILNNTVYRIKEVKPKFIWELNQKSTKYFKNYLCKKATTSFRGRTYEAWYTTEIPINFGPWKFSGLPGVILEIKDVTNSFIWKATKIVYPSNKFIKLPYKKYKNINLKEFVQLKIKNLEYLRARIKSILPRNAIIEKPEQSRRGLELKYEWEK